MKNEKLFIWVVLLINGNTNIVVGLLVYFHYIIANVKFTGYFYSYLKFINPNPKVTKWTQYKITIIALHHVVKLQGHE